MKKLNYIELIRKCYKLRFKWLFPPSQFSFALYFFEFDLVSPSPIASSPTLHEMRAWKAHKSEASGELLKKFKATFASFIELSLLTRFQDSPSPHLLTPFYNCVLVESFVKRKLSLWNCFSSSAELHKHSTNFLVSFLYSNHKEIDVNDYVMKFYSAQVIQLIF